MYVTGYRQQRCIRVTERQPGTTCNNVHYDKLSQRSACIRVLVVNHDVVVAVGSLPPHRRSPACDTHRGPNNGFPVRFRSISVCVCVCVCVCACARARMLVCVCVCV